MNKENVASADAIQEKKKFHGANQNKRKKYLLVAGVIIVAFAAAYLIVSLVFQNRFLPGTTINGVACGGKTVEQTEEILKQETESYVLTLAERGDAEEEIGRFLNRRKSGRFVRLDIFFVNTYTGIIVKI
ncbi:MAG: hypothetical protein LUG54_11140 [Clostridiales bacterium]|nr:hypothetical protein [Clostridiales bacterium]